MQIWRVAGFTDGKIMMFFPNWQFSEQGPRPVRMGKVRGLWRGERRKHFLGEWGSAHQDC